jgi:hypothetical protein
MDTYAIQKFIGWTPELSPPKDSPLFQWRALAGEVRPSARVAAAGSSFRGAAVAANPEARDFGSGPSDHPGMTA